MRKTLLAVAVILWFGGLASFVYLFWPREQHLATTTYVSEHLVKTTAMEVRIGDQTATITVPFPYTVSKPVHATMTKSPTREEQLRFACLSGAVSLVLLYCAIVIVSFGRCLWNGTAPPKSLELQLTGTVTFLMGIFGGALALPNPAPAVDNPSAYSTPAYPPPTVPPSYAPPLDPNERLDPSDAPTPSDDI